MSTEDLAKTSPGWPPVYEGETTGQYAARVAAETARRAEALTRSRRTAEEVVGEMGDEHGARHDALADALGADRRASWETLIEIATGVTGEVERLRADVALMTAMRDVTMIQRDEWRRRTEQAEAERTTAVEGWMQQADGIIRATNRRIDAMRNGADSCRWPWRLDVDQ